MSEAAQILVRTGVDLKAFREEILVNYWWNPAPKLGSPYAVLLHAALSLRDLPADQRAMWKSMFERLVFSDPEEALGHLPPTKRGLLSPPSPQRTREIREILAQTFTRS